MWGEFVEIFPKGYQKAIVGFLIQECRLWACVYLHPFQYPSRNDITKQTHYIREDGPHRDKRFLTNYCKTETEWKPD